MLTLLIIQLVAAIALSFFFTVNGLYFLLVFRTRRKEGYLDLLRMVSNQAISSEKLPHVSIVIPTYNKEAQIARKLQEIARIEYPRDKMQVVLVDDCSTDETVRKVNESMAHTDLEWKILRNVQRAGVNACYNVGVKESSGELIMTTDPDVTLSDDALMEGARVLLLLEQVGGVTGRTISVTEHGGPAFALEQSYRGIFERMFLAESAIHSTFPGYTACMLFRRSAFSPIPTEYGSSDGNISLIITKTRRRFIYVPAMSFSEPISGGFSEQKAQKVRRAARLIQSVLRNRNILFDGRSGEFGRLIFPLRFAMMLLCPTALVVGGLCVLILIMLVSVPVGLVTVLGFTFVAYLGITNVNRMNILGSLLAHQFYMLLGLFESKRRHTVWGKS